jgi:Ni,Fe-hydrogenase III small subunit
MADNVLGSKNPKNADSLLAAGMISEAEHKEIKSQAKKPKKAKKKSLMERWKELTN